MILDPYSQGLGAALGQNQGLYNNMGVNTLQADKTPTQPEAFVVPISMEDGSIKAIVVAEGLFGRKDEARPLLPMEQAKALVKALNHELEQQRGAARRVAEEQEKEFQKMFEKKMQHEYESYKKSALTICKSDASLSDKLKGAIKWLRK